MGKNSKIEWTDHTFNPWWGCTKISAACTHCYAESWAKRVGQKVWGPKAPRRFFSEHHWSEPLKWNNEASLEKRRLRVFCASMADVFEDRKDLNPARTKLWSLIEQTPQLDWLLLTKRPECIEKYTPWTSAWPSNVWLGTTIENQESADTRLDHIAKHAAAVRFISAEPLLGPLQIERWLSSTIDWVITGGESGPRARPSSPTWFRELLSQCMAANVPFHFKQWGDWAPGQGINFPAARKEKISEAADGTLMLRVGKKVAGRILDGATWDGLPRARIA
jgi:protein gp37